MTASRSRQLAYALALLGGCVSPSKYERIDVTLERIALRDAWLQTAVPFALAFCLVLLLVVLYYRRTGSDSLDGLFRPRRAPDVVGAARAWLRHRAELAPFQELLRTEKRRSRDAERAAKREVERAAELEAERAVGEARRVAEEALRALPPLGPPRLGFLSRFLIGFLAGVGVTAAIVLPFAASDPSGPGIVILLGGAGAINSLIASLMCAAVVSATPRKTVWFSMICGAMGAMVGPTMLRAGLPAAVLIIVLAAGALIGLSIGVADQMSRRSEPSR